MALHIKPLAGPEKNNLFILRPGFVIGRNEGNLIVPTDGRLSSRHAFIEAGDEGSWYLVDNSSKNGIKVNGETVPRVKLEHGLKIGIGTHIYEIVERYDGDSPPPPKMKARHWQELLVDLAKRHIPNLRNDGRAIVPLHPAVVLDFIRGEQAETRWVLGFGPRRVGAKSLDLPIFEPGAPDVCFEILPTPDGISFKTDYPEVVKLNDQSTSADILHIADVIKIKETEIEVDFIE